MVQRVIMNMEIRQMVGGGTSPELVGEGGKKKESNEVFRKTNLCFIRVFPPFSSADFHVEEVAGVQVHMMGLGPLNWVVRRWGKYLKNGEFHIL